MENRPSSPENQDEKDSSSSEKKQRGGSFLAQYLARRRESQVHETSAVERKEEDSSDKPKKWRKFFKGIFKNVVVPPEGHEVRKDSDYQFNPELWFAWQKKAEQPQAAVAQTTEPGGDMDTSIVTTEAAQFKEPIHAEQISFKAEETEPGDDTEKRIATSESVFSESQPLNSPNRVVSLKTRDIDDARKIEGYTAQPITPERPDAIDTTNNVPEREVVIERGVGSALPLAAVGLEYLARRKADKRIEKKMESNNTSVDRRLAVNERIQGELRAVTYQNEQQVEQLKRARGLSSEQRTEVGEIMRNERLSTRFGSMAQEKDISTSEAAMFRRSPEQQRPVSPEKPTFARSEIMTNVRDMPEVESRRILEQVAAAAEQDNPVERAFERSHEVKDDQSARPGAASVGAIMSQQTADHLEAAKVFNQHGDTAGLPTIADPARAAEAYRQAARAGFFGAVSIIILGFIAYLMIK